MKKFIAVLMAAVMALSLSATALADEGDLVISPAPPASGNDVDPGFNDYVDITLEQARAQLPYKGVNIWFGGKYMTFADAVPAIVNGRTQAPYRAVLEALGASVTYDSGKIRAKFEDGSVMDLAIGSKTMTYTKGDEVTTVEMDVAPYIDAATGRTFVPIRFIGETLGLGVTWSDELKVAYVVDWDAFVEETDKDFSNFNAMLAASMKAQAAAGKNYKQADSITLSGVLAGQEALDPLKLTLTGDSLTDGTNSSGTLTVGIDLGGYKSTIEALGEGFTSVVDTLNGAKVEYIMNDVNGLYLRSSLIALLSGGIVPEKAWLGIDINELYRQLGLDMGELLSRTRSADFTLGSLIRMICENGTLGQTMGYMAPDQAADMLAAIYKPLFGNDSVKITRSGSMATYACKAGMAELTKAVVSVDPSLTESDVKEELSGMTFNMDLTMSVRGENVTSITANMDMALEGVLSMTMKSKGDAKNTDMTITLKADEIGTLEMKIVSKLTETGSKPLDKPASGDEVISYEELVNLIEQAYSDLVPDDQAA